MLYSCNRHFSLIFFRYAIGSVHVRKRDRIIFICKSMHYEMNDHIRTIRMIRTICDQSRFSLNEKTTKKWCICIWLYGHGQS